MTDEALQRTEGSPTMTEPAEPRALVALHRFSRAVTIFKLVCWTIFAAVGPVTFFLMKNYVGVAVTSGCSLLIACLALGPGVTTSALRPALRAFLVVQGVAGAALSVHVLTAAPEGWTREVESTRQALVAGPEGVIYGLAFSERADLHARSAAGTAWRSEPFPGGLALDVAFSPAHGAILASEARAARLLVRPADPPVGAGPAPRWTTLGAPGIDTDILVAGHTLLLRGGGRLERLALPSGQREVVAGLGLVTVACASGDRVLAVHGAPDGGARAWESSDGGRTFRDAPGVRGEATRCAIAGDGTAYVARSGMFTGGLQVRSAGAPFTAREPPLARIEAIHVNPANGQEVWLAGWGGGVFRSVDGGATWTHLGLHGFEVEAILVDHPRGTVLAATGSGIYSRRFASP